MFMPMPFQSWYVVSTFWRRSVSSRCLLGAMQIHDPIHKHSFWFWIILNSYNSVQSLWAIWFVISQPQLSRDFSFAGILSCAGCKRLMESGFTFLSFCLTWIFGHFFHFCVVNVMALMLHISLKHWHMQCIVSYLSFLPCIKVPSSPKLAQKTYTCLFRMLYAEGFNDFFFFFFGLSELSHSEPGLQGWTLVISD